MINWTERRDRFRAIINGTDCIRPASVFDPLSARIAEHLGFEIGLFAGSIASLTILGAPDLVLLTASELVQQTQRICRATSMPLLVDGDHGYGTHSTLHEQSRSLQMSALQPRQSRTRFCRRHLAVP
jgi:carboxyvinyl-carboxyphosphonate phosphorylmutase